MQISGNLVQNKIQIKKPKDVGRFYNKSNFGNILSGNILELELIEGIFLVESNKLKVYKNKKEVKFDELIKLAIKNYDNFVINYLVFKDLRNRGIIINNSRNDHFTFEQMKIKDKKGKNYVCVFSERSIFNVQLTLDLLNEIETFQGNLWYAIVDEEGDITYYEIQKFNPNGDIKKDKYVKFSGIFVENRVIIFDKNISLKLHKNEFFGKPFGEGLQLSLIEALYLIEGGFLQIELKDINNLKKEIIKIQPDIEDRITIYKDLKNKGLIVKTGFKFGTHFRAYTKNPDQIHAEFLIHIIKQENESMWEEISRAVRLAHSVNKEILFARLSKNKKIDYIKFGRLRP